MDKEIINEINKRLFDTIPEWLPEAIRTSQGYKAVNPLRGDKDPSSMTIFEGGRAHDFAANDSPDCINFWAVKNGLDNKAAIKQLADKFSLGAGVSKTTGSMPIPSFIKIEKTAQTETTTPQYNYPPTPYPIELFTHYQHGTPSFVYPYYNSDTRLIGYTCRFDLKDGSKVVLPFTYSDTIGKNKDGSLKKSDKLSWHWNAYGWKNNWPIYGLEKLNKNPNATVLIVEGEKTCDAAQRLLPDYVVVSWAGGVGKADKVNWDILKGRTIIIFPDADLKKNKYTDELIQKNHQPGMKAAIQIAQELESEKPKIVVPPAGMADGWDLADAEKEGWTTSQVYEYLTKSAFTEEELEKQLGIAWRLKHKIELKPDDYILNLPKYAIPEDLEERFFPLVCVEERLTPKGEIKHEINVSRTIERYMKEYIEIDYKSTDEFVQTENETEARKIAIIAKRSQQIKTHKSLLNQIWCDCNKTIRRGATREEVENHFTYILEQKREKALEALKEKTAHDGTTFKDALLITTVWIAHALTSGSNLTIEFIKSCEPVAKAILHFIWQVQRKMNGYQAEMHMMPLFMGAQGNGKSEFVKNICKVLCIPYGNFVRDIFMDEIGEEKNEPILAQTLINILDEMAGASKVDLAKYKNFSSRHTVNTREFNTQRTMGEMVNLSTFIGCANIQNLNEILHDDSGNRRFFPIRVESFIKKTTQYNGEGTDLMLEKFTWVKEQDELFPYDFDALPLWKMVNYKWGCFVRDESIAAVQAEHRYEPVKQWLENFGAKIITREEYKSHVMNASIPDELKIASTGFLREIFLNMYKLNAMEAKKWSLTKFALELKKLGYESWVKNERGLFRGYTVFAITADWSQIDGKIKFPWND